MFQMIVMANNNISANEDRILPGTATSPLKDDLVGRWEVPLCDGIHIIEFEHGTTSGKRVVTVDGKEILRREWMFRLVGDETLMLGPKRDGSGECRQHVCTIRVDPKPAFNYQYALHVDGLELSEFIQKQALSMIVWTIPRSDPTGNDIRVTFDKQTLDVWAAGKKVETEGEFTDNGTKTNFLINDTESYILGVPSGNKKDYIQYEFYYDNVPIDETK